MATNMVRYTPPVGVTPLGEAIEQLFRDAFTWPHLSGGAQSNGRNYGLGVNSNLYETGESYIMQVLLPGVKVDDLQITSQKNVLVLRGTVGVPAPEGAQAIWVGTPSGDFSEQATLPGEVDAEKATAAYSDGVLTLTLPKAEAARVKTIKITSAGQQSVKA